MCSLFDCKEEAIEFWGEQAQYILLRCNRCNKEMIQCCFEGKKLNHDKMGLTIMNKMMKDAEFSYACHIHQQFKDVEEKYALNFNKREEEFNKLKIKFNLSNITRPADPIILFQNGIWDIDKPEFEEPVDFVKEKKSKKKDRENFDSPPPLIENNESEDEQEEIISQGEVKETPPEVKDIKFQGEIEGIEKLEMNKSEYFTNDVKPITYEFDKEGESKLIFSVDELKNQLEEFLEKEDYESAAKIRDRINEIENF